MAITSTGAIYKSLIFDGKSSRDYGVYITGQAVYNAPEREVEMISIPGRNGQFALDKGRFENIEVTYPAGIFADSETDFAEAISDFRNFLCSRKGYVRLTDEYNPNEYRMAIYKSGLEVEPALLRAGEFEIVFDCKPQRYLTSGEHKSRIDIDGVTLTNPTLFPSSPLIEAWGYGSIKFNGYEIKLTDDDVGPLTLLEKGSMSANTVKEFNLGLMDNGDAITVSPVTIKIQLVARMAGSTLQSLPTHSESGDSVTYSASKWGNKTIVCTYKYAGTNSTKGQTLTKSTTASLTIVETLGGGSTMTHNLTFTIGYEAYLSGDTGRFYACASGRGESLQVIASAEYDGISGVSTQSILGDPTYIDCDLGEAYKLIDGKPSSLNAYIDLGSNLPELAVGENTFEVDDTFNNVLLTPRWWKV